MFSLLTGPGSRRPTTGTGPRGVDRAMVTGPGRYAVRLLPRAARHAATLRATPGRTPAEGHRPRWTVSPRRTIRRVPPADDRRRRRVPTPHRTAGRDQWGRDARGPAVAARHR